MFGSQLVHYVGMIRGCGLVGKDVLLLEMGLELSKAPARLSLAFSASYLGMGCKLLAIAPMLCLPACLTVCLPAIMLPAIIRMG